MIEKETDNANGNRAGQNRDLELSGRHVLPQLQNVREPRVCEPFS